MTACNVTLSSPIEAPLTAQPIDTTVPLVLSSDPQRPFLERLAARISSSTDEIAAFTTVDNAARALALTYFLGRRIGLVATPSSPLSREARLSAQSTRSFDLPRDLILSALIEFARSVDVLVIEAPQLVGSEIREPLTPRQLLELRARSPQTLIVLDLLNEDLARTPLTQAALLIPGVLVLRGFGSLWEAEGATNVAGIAFVIGAPKLLTRIACDNFSAETRDRAILELDSTDIDRRVQSKARQTRSERMKERP